MKSKMLYRFIWLGKLPVKVYQFWCSNWFDSGKSFLSLPSFWFPTAFIIFLSLAIHWAMIDDTNFYWCWKADCVNAWAATFRVPIAIFALLIPVLGLLNANHKSEQAKAAMELSKSQNTFANYYKHAEEFGKYVKDMYGKALIEKSYTIDSRILYTHLFPNSKVADYRIHPEVIRKMHEFVDFILTETENVWLRNSDELRNSICNLEIQRGSFYHFFGYSLAVLFPEEDSDRSANVFSIIFEDGTELYVYVPYGIIENYFEWISMTAYCVHRICHFGDHYVEENQSLFDKFKLLGEKTASIKGGRVKDGAIAELPKYRQF